MTAENELKTVSAATLRRLPRYLSHLRMMQRQGLETVSAAKLGLDLDVQHTQVRKDLACTGAEGTPKVGHRVAELIELIESFLNWNNSSEAFLVGAGSLGSALLGFREGFRETGIEIVAAFDSDLAKIGKRIHGVETLDLRKLASLARRMHVHIGILTVPASEAQTVSEAMISGGIEAIWNFAPIQLNLPSSVIVENMDMQASLALLSFKLKSRLAPRKKQSEASRRARVG